MIRTIDRHRRWLAAVALWSATGVARADLDADEVLRLRERGEIVPLAQLLATVEMRYPAATLIDVELDEDDGRLIYELEVITATRVVRELEFDARDATLLKDEIED